MTALLRGWIPVNGPVWSLIAFIFFSSVTDFIHFKDLVVSVILYKFVFAVSFQRCGFNLMTKFAL